MESGGKRHFPASGWLHGWDVSWMAHLPVPWEGLLKDEATEREAELRDVMGKIDSQGYMFEPLDPAVPEAEYFKNHF